jgi:hypothetical protein
MANETTTTTVAHSLNSEFIDPRLRDFAIASQTTLQFFRRGDLAGHNSKVWTVLIFVKDVAADITEGTAMTNTALDTGDTSITAAEVGILREITKLASRTSMIDLESYVAQDGGKLCMELAEDDAVALFAGLSTSVGTSGSNYTVADLMEAIALIGIANAGSDALVAVVHPRQAGDLMASMSTQTGAAWGNMALSGGLLGRSTIRGYVGAPLGVPHYTTSMADTANGAEDRVGAVFTNGNPETGGDAGRATFGWANLWLPELASESNVANSSNLYAITMCYGVGELNDYTGVKIVTDA